MNREVEQAITEEDLDFLDEVLSNYGGDDAISCASELDGFLTAIASGPDMIMPGEWMQEIWGGEDKLPEWASEDESLRFMELAVAMMNGNIELLMEQPEDFQALFLIDLEDGKPIELPELWCCGYMRAVAMRPESWEMLPSDMEIHLYNIALFGTEQGEEALDGLEDEETNLLASKIEPAALALHAYWLAQRSDLAPPPPFPHNPIRPVVSPPKVGRNQPCPCGSGKKYKHCCLH